MNRLDRLYFFCAVNYFAQGMGGLVYEPLNYLLKDGLHLGPGETAVFVAWMTIPFLIKPLFGLLTDLVPLAGRLRRPHLILGAALGTASWLALALFPHYRYAPLLALCTLVNFSTALCDVVGDAVMVETGKAGGKTGTYQAVQIGTLYATLVLTGVGGGWLAAHASMRTVFALAALFPLLIAASAVWIDEMPGEPPIREGARHLRELFCSKRFWVLCLMIFLWNFYPFLGTAQFFYQSEALRFDPIYIGVLSTLGCAAGVAGAAFFGSTIKRWGTSNFLRAGIWLGASSSLLCLLYLGPISAAIITVIMGFFSVTFRLALMDLSAQSCPEHVEATAFAVYMAVFNLAAWASNTVGGQLYDRLKIAFQTLPDPSYAAAAVLILIGSVCTLTCWWLIPGVGTLVQSRVKT